MLLGHGPLLELGRNVSPWPFYLFFFLSSFSFFCFLISLITFANLVQFASNHLCEVSKIPSNIPEQ
jgi:hypothetical protein